MVKFADDSAVLSLLLGIQDGHGAALDDFTEWCDDFTEWCDDFTEWCDESYLELNVNQTKEMIVDTRRRRHTDRAIEIHDEKVEIVHSYKYLGTIFEDTLQPKTHTSGNKPWFQFGGLTCLLYTSPSPRDMYKSRMPSSA